MSDSRSYVKENTDGNRSSTAVSLKAREVLIAGQMPSYEERAIQMESVLKASVSTSYYGEQTHDHRY